MKREQNFMAGASASASGEVIGHVPVSTPRDVEAASAAFPNFRELTASARADYPMSLHAEILRNTVALAELKVLPGTELGPLIVAAAMEKVGRCSHDAVALGAMIVTGGYRMEGAGTFFAPTISTILKRSTSASVVWRRDA